MPSLHRFPPSPGTLRPALASNVSQSAAFRTCGIRSACRVSGFGDWRSGIGVQGSNSFWQRRMDPTEGRETSAESERAREMSNLLTRRVATRSLFHPLLQPHRFRFELRLGDNELGVMADGVRQKAVLRLDSLQNRLPTSELSLFCYAEQHHRVTAPSSIYFTSASSSIALFSLQMTR
eukprot:601972-Rhodomonas_salina.1